MRRRTCNFFHSPRAILDLVNNQLHMRYAYIHALYVFYFWWISHTQKKCIYLTLRMCIHKSWFPVTARLCSCTASSSTWSSSAASRRRRWSGHSCDMFKILTTTRTQPIARFARIQSLLIKHYIQIIVYVCVWIHPITGPFKSYFFCQPQNQFHI